MNPLVTPAELGHDMQPHEVLGQLCSKCGSVPGSDDGVMPCGDRLGSRVRRVATLRDGKHAWNFVWKGKTIGWCWR